MHSYEITRDLHENGYAFLPGWRKDCSTLSIGQSAGKIIDMDALLPQGSIHTVQTLRPRHKSNARSNLYSGLYGFGEFPFHTDLAHWAVPPRYFILRCIIGSTHVYTKILNSEIILRMIDNATIARAMFSPRCIGTYKASCLLRFMFSIDGVHGVRWDPKFLLSMNRYAGQVSKFFSNSTWPPGASKLYALVDPGDTLIVDNWKILHGRSAVPAADTGRTIERIYLSELKF